MFEFDDSIIGLSCRLVISLFLLISLILTALFVYEEMKRFHSWARENWCATYHLKAYDQGVELQLIVRSVSHF